MKTYEELKSGYPVLLFSVRQGDVELQFYRAKGGECWAPNNPKTQDLIYAIEEEFFDWFRDKVAAGSSGVDEDGVDWGLDETENGVYYGLVEEFRAELQKTFPDMIIGDIQIDRDWYPLSVRFALL